MAVQVKAADGINITPGMPWGWIGSACVPVNSPKQGGQFFDGWFRSDPDSAYIRHGGFYVHSRVTSSDSVAAGVHVITDRLRTGYPDATACAEVALQSRSW